MAGAKILTTLACFMLLKMVPSVTYGIQGFRSFRRLDLLSGFELSGNLIANRSEDGMRLTECAMWCYQRRCATYSFFKRGSVGICKLGRNPYAKRPKKRSNIYFVVDDSDPMASDGLQYTMSANHHYNLATARASCTHWRRGGLPVIYPSEVTYRAVRRLNTSNLGEKIFVDLQPLGDFSERQFISGCGESMDASQTSKNPALHWGPSQPNAVSNATGQFVTMDLDTGLLDDTGNSSLMTYIVCSNDSSSYRYMPATKKYYKMFTDGATHPGANRTCQADGGRLAITYGVNGRFPVLDHYSSALLAKFWVGGTNAPAGNSVFTFEDGTTINSTNRATDTARQKWYGSEPVYLSTRNCMYVYDGSMFSLDCDYRFPFLCEREYP